MKKSKCLIILLLLFAPILSVKSYQLRCEYKDGSKTAYLMLDCPNGTCKITSGEVTAYGSTHPIGFIASGRRAIELDEATDTFDYCMGQIGLDHPISAGVGIVKPHFCDGSPEYGCFQFDKATRIDDPEPEPAPLDPSNKYSDIISCRDVDYNYIKDCGCMPASLTDLTSRLYMLIKIAAPALLLIIGGFDLIKAMSAQDEKAINKARQKLVRKFIAAAAVFLIFTLVQFIVSRLASDSASTIKCVDYLLNGYVA